MTIFPVYARMMPMIDRRFSLPSNASVFVIDDNHERLDWFSLKLQKVQDVVMADNVPEGLDIVKSRFFDFIFFDHDMGFMAAPDPYSSCYVEATTIPVAMHVASWPPGLRPHAVIHSWNYIGARRIHAILPYAHICEFGKFDIKIGDRI